MRASFLLLALAGAARAAAPSTLTYQGRLKESGLPVSGFRTVDIQVCDAPAPGGTCYDAGAQGVPVTNGLFRVVFPVPAGVTLESGVWYLEIRVNGNVFAPREQLSSSAYAVMASSASTLSAAPGAASVVISTPVAIAAMDASGYSLSLSSGISAPLGTVSAKYFVGNGSGLTGIATVDGTKVLRTGDSMSGPLNMIGAGINLTGAGGSVVSAASVTASSFWGDGSHLTGVAASGGVLKTGDFMTGGLTLVGGSTLTVSGSSFSVAGSSFVVSGGSVGIGAFAPAARFHLSSGTLLADGTMDQGAPSGPGTRFVWLPSSGAIRAGQVAGSQWDPANIGVQSVAFGYSPTASGAWSFVGGGQFNVANAARAAVAGGDSNTASNIAAFVGGGTSNSASGAESVVPGGRSNSASGDYSFAGGNGAQASQNYSFVWASGVNPAAFAALAPEEVAFRANGGVRFVTGLSTFSISAAGDVTAASSVTASSFWGDGSHLTGVNAGSAVQKTGDEMTGPLTMNSASTITVTGNAFSVGASTFAVIGGNVGIGTPNPDSALRVAGGITNDPSSTPAAPGQLKTQQLILNDQLAFGYTAGTTLMIGSGGAWTATDFYSSGVQAMHLNAAGSLGIGTPSPAGKLHMSSGTFLVDGTTDGGAPSGGGTRMVFLPSLGALRAGSVAASQWDPANIGLQSVAFGLDSRASGNYTTVAGGSGNTAQTIGSSIGGGQGNVTNGIYSTVGGGSNNQATGSYATIPGGFTNTATGSNSFAAGLNAHAAANGSFVWADDFGGAFTSTIENEFKVRAQGGFDVTGSSFSIVGATGTLFTVDASSAQFAVPLFGDGSHLTGVASATSVQKTGDTMTGSLSITPGGLSVNSGAIYATGTLDTLGALAGPGTRFMWIPSSAAFRAGVVGNTEWNTIGAHSVAFGQNNNASADNTVIAGGLGNSAIGAGAAIGGGSGNTASNSFAMVPGGSGNTAAGQYSFAAGRNAAALVDGDFVWADSLPGGLSTSIQNQFLARAGGGVDFVTSSFTVVGAANTLFTVDATSADFKVPLYGDGSHLTGVLAPGAVAKTGDVMTGSLELTGASTITVRGSEFSVAAATFAVKGGNVGIGTANPQYLLDMFAPIGSPGKGLHVQTPNSGVYNHLYLQGAGLQYYYSVEGNPRYLIDSDAINGYGSGQAGLFFATVGGGAAPSLGLGTDLNSNLGFYVGGAATGNQKMALTSLGRLGVGTQAPGAALEAKGVAGDPAVALFRDATNVVVASVTAGGVFAGTQQWSFTLYDQQGIQATDDIPSVISNRLGEPVTITEVWCESDDATASINLHRSGAGIGTNVLVADLTCAAGSSSTVFTVPENQVAGLGKLDFLTQSVTAGAAKRINVVVKYQMH